MEWDAALINDQPPDLIAWRSLRGAEVANAGSVHFHDAPDGGTEIRVRLQYDPPVGKLGAWVSALLGEDPAQQIRDDLQRLQQLFDRIGSPPTRGSLGDGRAACAARGGLISGDRPMLMTLAVILLVLWLLGIVTGYTVSAFIHVLLVVAIVLIIAQFVTGRTRV